VLLHLLSGGGVLTPKHPERSNSYGFVTPMLTTTTGTILTLSLEGSLLQSFFMWILS